ncbi:MAG: 2-succinyl-6-hydroxy-2,4-cyclohexadiene-1-carboxylate synthase [Myxococcota bacterium]
MSGAGRARGDAPRPAARSVFVEAGGLRLHALVDEPVATRPDRPELLVLHGFTGCAASMAGVALALAADARVVRLELVGHGASDAPAAPALYAMAACAEQVGAAARALARARPHLLGYSMGGRAALAAALAAPEAFTSLILIGATAGIADPAARAERIASDERLALEIERDGLERFVDAWMEQPLFASQARLGPEARARARAERLAQRPHGLANSLRGMGAGAQLPLHDRLGELALPVLLVVGEADAKFRAIAAELARAIPHARVEVVPGAGHAAHLEAPDHFSAIVRAFLAEVGSAARAGRVATPAAEGGARR